MSCKKKTKLDSTGNASTVRLAIDNQEMEDRLKSLKKIMALEKIQRTEATQGGKAYWKSSETKMDVTHSTTSNQNNHHVLTLKNKKVKVLTGSEEYTRKNKISCGQCDQYKASIVCVECIENYCTVCFTKFHQKGALSNHRVRPLNKVQVKECPQTSKPCSSTMGVQTDSTPSITDHHSQQHQVHNETGSNNGTLLDGTYDEEASSKSFQDALLAWRNDNKVTADTDVSLSTNTCGIQTTSSSSVSPSRLTPSDIHFINSPSSSGLSYMERLMLQRKRSDPSFLRIQYPITNKHRTHHDNISNGGCSTYTEEEDIHKDIGNGGRLSEHNLFYSKDETVIAEPRPLEYATPTPRDYHPLLHTSSSSVVIQEFMAAGGDHSDDDTGGDHGNTITTDHTGGDHAVTTDTDDSTDDTITPSNTLSSNKLTNRQQPPSNEEDGQHPFSEDRQHPSSNEVKDRRHPSTKNNQHPSRNKVENKRRPANKKEGGRRKSPPLVADKPRHVTVSEPTIGASDTNSTKPLSDDIRVMTVAGSSYSHTHNKTYSSSLSSFFMMDTPTIVQEIAEDEDTTDTHQHQPTTISDTLLKQTMWSHSVSIVTDKQHDSKYIDTVQIDDIPPPTLCLTNTELPQEDTDDDSDHCDDGLMDDSVSYAVALSDNEDEGREDDVLEDLSRELVLVSRAEENHRKEEYDGDTDDEEVTEEALRALSRMTIEQLVQDFEEYQMQVMSNED